MIKLKPRYLGLTLLIMAKSAIEAAENKRPEVGVLINMTSFSIVLHLPTAVL